MTQLIDKQTPPTQFSKFSKDNTKAEASLESRKARFYPVKSESLRVACGDGSTWVLCTSVAAIQKREIWLLWMSWGLRG